MAAKTPEKKMKSGRRIMMIAEHLLNLYEDKILLPPPSIDAAKGDIPVGKVSPSPIQKET